MDKRGIYFIYDGECPICTYGSHAFRIKESIGSLHLIDAREDSHHPLIAEVGKRGLSLDEGMVIVYQDVFYHGKDALHLMALVGSGAGWFNKINAFLFRSKTMVRLCYPAMRGTRTLLLHLKGVPQIGNLDRKTMPVFKSVFGASWDKLPPVMQKHYANRAYHDDITIAQGSLDIEASRIGRLFFPLFRLMKTLIPCEGKAIPTTVRFITARNSDSFQLDRRMVFPDGSSYHFHSRMKPLGGNELIEIMSCGLGWHMAYAWTDGKVTLQHRGYKFSLLGFLIPLPLTLLLGTGYAEEVPLNDNEFAMMTEIRHPLWGKIYGYSGTFRIKEDLPCAGGPAPSAK